MSETRCERCGHYWPSLGCFCGCHAPAPAPRMSEETREAVEQKIASGKTFTGAEVRKASEWAYNEIAALRRALGEGCWLWDGEISTAGYGRVRVNGKKRQAHRMVYEALVGLIPCGLELDHLCRTRTCVNPKHLEPVTGKENRRRGVSFSAKNIAKTACPKGHAYTAYDTARGVKRKCQKCNAASHRRRYVKAGSHV